MLTLAIVRRTRNCCGVEEHLLLVGSAVQPSAIADLVGAVDAAVVLDDGVLEGGPEVLVLLLFLLGVVGEGSNVLVGGSGAGGHCCGWLKRLFEVCVESGSGEGRLVVELMW